MKKKTIIKIISRIKKDDFIKELPIFYELKVLVECKGKKEERKLISQKKEDLKKIKVGFFWFGKYWGEALELDQNFNNDF